MREERRAEWEEIDPGGRVWTIPARRMKGNRHHRWPPCDLAEAAWRKRVHHLPDSSAYTWSGNL